MQAQRKPVIDISLLIAFSSALIYLCTFEFERGICKYYQIPEVLIDPNLLTILIFASVMFFVFLLVFAIGLFLVLLLDHFPKTITPLTRAVIVFNVSFFIIIWISAPYAFHINRWLAELYFLFSGNILLFVLRAFSKFMRNLALGKLPNVNERTQYLSSRPSKYLVSRLGFISYYIFAFTFLPALSNFIGNDFSSHIYRYSVIHTSSDYLLLKKYGELLICRKINLKNKTVSKSLIVFKLKDDREYSITELDNFFVPPAYKIFKTQQLWQFAWDLR